MAIALCAGVLCTILRSESANITREKNMLKYIRRILKPHYITNGWVLWKYDGLHLRPRTGEGIRVGTDEWLKWCDKHKRLIFYDERIGWFILKKEAVKRKGIIYYYWRGFKWYAHKRTPVRIYVGILDNITTKELRAKMRDLKQRSEEKSTFYRDEKERIKRNKKSAQKRRWYKRYKQRKSDSLLSSSGGQVSTLKTIKDESE